MKTSQKPGHHILVVDDEPMVSQAIKLLLKFDGHTVETVDCGKAALARLEQNLFDLVITDYSMAGIKGDQLAAIIKERWPGQPVIMATAFAAGLYPSGKPSGGVDCVLNKPFSLVELRDGITLVMSLKAARPATLAPSASPAGSAQVRKPTGSNQPGS